MTLHLDSLKVLVIHNSCNNQTESFFNYDSFVLALKNMGLIERDIPSRFSKDYLIDFYADNYTFTDEFIEFEEKITKLFQGVKV